MKILVVDDHVLIREALRDVLKEISDDASVLEASDHAATVRLLNAHGDIQLLLLDLHLPDGDGLSMLAKLREDRPEIPVIVLTGLCERSIVLKALDGGALGFIPKTSSREVMVQAIRLVLAGGVYIPQEALQQPGAAPAEQRSPNELGLTERQLEVLALMLQGKSNKAICRALDVAEATVKNHVTAILKALNVSTRAHIPNFVTWACIITALML